MRLLCLVLFSLLSCTPVPRSVERFHSICKQETEWCREAAEILNRIEAVELAHQMGTACGLHRAECAECPEDKEAQWDLLNDIMKVQPSLLVDSYLDQ